MTSFSCFKTPVARGHTEWSPRSSAKLWAARPTSARCSPALASTLPHPPQHRTAQHSHTHLCSHVLISAPFFLCLEWPSDCLNCSFKTPSRNHLWWGLPFLPLGYAQAFYSAWEIIRGHSDNQLLLLLLGHMVWLPSGHVFLVSFVPMTKHSPVT